MEVGRKSASDSKINKNLQYQSKNKVDNKSQDYINEKINSEKIKNLFAEVNIF